jgi:S1-C subfamily serine protease
VPPATPPAPPGWSAGGSRPLLPASAATQEWTTPPAPAPTTSTSKRVLAIFAVIALVVMSAGIGAVAALALHKDGGTTQFALPTTPTLPTSPFNPGSGNGSTNNGNGPLAQGQLNINGTGTLDAEGIARRVIPGLVNINTIVGSGQAAGSGIIISPTGAILTNNHVIADSTEVKVTVGGTGPTYDAKVVGYSVEDDVALLQIEQKVSNLPAVTLGNPDNVRIGDQILAIGNALGKGGLPTVSQGQVTGLDKQVTAGDERGQTETLYEMIQIDAPIQPGNSGGALIDDQGRVIGVNTAAAGSRFRITAGNVGFAIRIDNAMDIVKQIQSGKEGNGVHIGARGLLGVNVSELNSTNTAGRPAQIAPVDEGVLIVGLQANSGASDAGIGEGDVITSVNGKNVSNTEDLQQAMVGLHPDDQVKVSWVDVNGDNHTENIRLVEGPPA